MSSAATTSLTKRWTILFRLKAWKLFKFETPTGTTTLTARFTLSWYSYSAEIALFSVSSSESDVICDVSNTIPFFPTSQIYMQINLCVYSCSLRRWRWLGVDHHTHNAKSDETQPEGNTCLRNAAHFTVCITWTVFHQKRWTFSCYYATLPKHHCNLDQSFSAT